MPCRSEGTIQFVTAADRLVVRCLGHQLSVPEQAAFTYRVEADSAFNSSNLIADALMGGKHDRQAKAVKSSDAARFLFLPLIVIA